MKVELVDVGFTYSPGTPFERRVFEGLNFKIEPGKFVLITGRNGSGKTTLLQIIALVMKPTSGKVLIDGQDAWTSPRKWRRKIGFSFQFPENQFFSLSVFVEVVYAPKNFGIKSLEDSYQRAMALVGLEPGSYRNLIPYVLSGGEKRKVGIASIISHDPELLVLDEPMVSLDWPSRKEMLSFLEKWKASGKSAAVATHNTELFKKLADDILVL